MFEEIKSWGGESIGARQVGRPLISCSFPASPDAFCPFRVVVDPSMPEDTVEFRYGQRIVGRIINIKKGEESMVEKEKDVSQEVVKEYLRCLLTEKEKTELSSTIAKTISDKGILEGRLKEVTTSLKADMAKCDAQISEIAQQINNGYIYRNVDCRMEKNYRLGSVTITRLDTGEIIRERPMTSEERQMKLSVKNGEKAKDKDSDKEKKGSSKEARA